MLCKRIIPCLDIADGRVVKGTSFVDLHDAGDPLECARRYNRGGADELMLLDIQASHQNKPTILGLVEQVASQVFIPLTVGGGVRQVDDVQQLLRAGADKVSVNTAAIHNPDLVKQAAQRFGNQCIVVAIDAKQTTENNWEIFTHGGRNPTGIDAVAWAKKMAGLGCGEILLTSMDQDGQKTGFDLALTSQVVAAVNIPVIASGGVGSLADLYDGFIVGKAHAVLAASIFHFGEYSIQQAKTYLRAKQVEVR